MKFKKLVSLVLVVIFLSVFSIAVFAQDFPTRDIRTIVPFSAGGGVDAIGRVIGKIAEESIPVNIYVENIAGALSGTGLYEVMKAAPDGYTLGIVSYAGLVSVPYQQLIEDYSLDKLKMICLITEESGGIVVKADSPWKDWEEFSAAAKKAPGKITVGVTGEGGALHIRLLKIEKATGIETKMIPYSGGAGELKEALLSGEIDAVVSGVSDFAELAMAGEVRGLIETGTQRNSNFPEIRTFVELGYDNLISGSFCIIATTAGTPDEVVKKLEKIYYDAHHSDEFRDWAKKTGVTPTWLGIDEVTDYAMRLQKEEFELLETIN